jgi:hypothetical protein
MEVYFGFVGVQRKKKKCPLAPAEVIGRTRNSPTEKCQIREIVLVDH